MMMMNQIEQPIQKQLSEPTSDSSTDEDQIPLSKTIIRPWEEIRNNKHRTSIGYEKEVTFHIQIIPNRSSSRVLDYFKKVHIHLL
jgi:hypothetical protein